MGRHDVAVEERPGRHSRTDEPVDLTEWYQRYNDVCNAHDFHRLGEFVAEHVVVNGEPQGLDGFRAGLEDVVAAFPDYRWELHHLLVGDPWLAAHFVDTGTHRGPAWGIPPTGRAVRTQEFAFYRVVAGLITEVWVTADNLSVLKHLTD